MATIWERSESGDQDVATEGDKSSAVKRYGVQIDWASETEVTAVALVNSTAPSTYLGYDKKTVSLKPQGADIFFFEVKYDSRDQQKPGDNTFSFDTTGSNEKIYYSRNTIASYIPAGGAAAPDCKGGINVTEHGVEGVDIQTRKFSFEASQTYSPTDITSDVIGAIHRMTGMVNNDDWSPTIKLVTFVFYAGEVRFDGARGTFKPDGTVEITYKFTASLGVNDPDDDNTDPRRGFAFPVGNIRILVKQGWDYLWIKYKQNTSGGATIQNAVAAYIEQVYEQTPFTDPFTTLGF
jgi:hypothetical protein